MLMLYEVDDERASSAVHIVAFLLAVLLLAFSVDLVPAGPGPRAKLTVFAAFMVLMYLASALFHASPQGRWKEMLERVDRAAIFLFIAASYSLFQLQEQAALSTAVWTLAAAGAAVSIVCPPQRALAIVLPYVALGWLAVGGIAWQARSMSEASLALLIVGALVYTAGLVYYLAPRVRRFSHAGWHLFVALGSPSIRRLCSCESLSREGHMGVGACSARQGCGIGVCTEIRALKSHHISMGEAGETVRR